MNELSFVVGRSFSLPIIVSLALLIRLWWNGELFGIQQRVFCSWFIAALATQVFARNLGFWIAGFLAQVILAIVLVLKQQIDDIY